MINKNKKGTFAIMAIVIIIILVIASAVFLIFYGKSQGWFMGNKNKEEVEQTATIYLVAIEIPSEEEITANYSIFGDGYRREGVTLKESPTSLVVPINVDEENTQYEIYFWNENHYLQYCPAILNKGEINKTLKISCALLKFGDLKVGHEGSIEGGTIELNISSEDHLRRLGICLSWSAGITTAKLKNNRIDCPKGNWLNYSCYYPPNATSKEPFYCWLPENKYQCNYLAFGEKTQEETCETVERNTCFPPEMPYGQEPIRLKNEVDICYNTGKSLLNSSELFEIEVKTNDQLSCGFDYLKVFILDKERYRNGNNYIFGYENNLYQDIGREDLIYEITPENC